MRDMLFASHANPEDNSVARWLAFRLASAGYGVWCDLTRLLGGERFWESIEEAVRERTAKFLFVLSRASNTKPGPRDELELALRVQREANLRSFVIPLWIDDLPASQFNVRLQNINAIRFQEGWAGGLGQLLEKLTADSVPKSPQFGPEAVTAWWRSYGAAVHLREESEPLVSNWYPIALPPLHLHQIGRRDIGVIDVPGDAPWPAAQHGQLLLSFAPAEALAHHLGPVEIQDTRRLTADGPELRPPYSDLPRSIQSSLLVQLLKRSWQRFLLNKGLPRHDFANRNLAFYFRKGLVANDRLPVRLPGGGSSWRSVVGYSTLHRADGTSYLRHWHFALHARPVAGPEWYFAMKPHVLFSDDGTTIWASADRLQRARRAQCKRWWNAKWRDLIAASVQWLAGDEGVIKLSVAPTEAVRIAASPIMFVSPLSYDEAELEPHEDEDEVDEDENEDERDEEEPEEERDTDAPEGASGL